jgi:hypothetical protein
MPARYSVTVASGVVVPEIAGVWSVVMWSVDDDPVSLLMLGASGCQEPFHSNRVSGSLWVSGAFFFKQKALGWILRLVWPTTLPQCRPRKKVPDTNGTA